MVYRPYGCVNIHTTKYTKDITKWQSTLYITESEKITNMTEKQKF